MCEQETSTPSKFSAEYRSGFAVGLRLGVEMTEHNCVDGGACLVPPVFGEGPIPDDETLVRHYLLADTES